MSSNRPSINIDTCACPSILTFALSAAGPTRGACNEGSSSSHLSAALLVHTRALMHPIGGRFHPFSQSTAAAVGAGFGFGGRCRGRVQPQQRAGWDFALQCTAACRSIAASGSPLHLLICPHTQELLNMLNESADAIGLHIRRFKCNTTSQCLDVHALIARVPQAPPTVPSMSASTPLWDKTGECMRAPYLSH